MFINISERLIQYIPPTFGNLSSLQDPSLQRDKLQTLPSNLGSLQNLQTLTLKDCEEMMHLPASLGELSNLQDFALDCTRLLGFPNSFSNIQTLAEIDVGVLVSESHDSQHL